ncbi:RES family NAD+ phosphorylase [Microvirga brassicacearum]|uniref:RES domain-containing protein n=1 Tax=Microvirga brassicacearum TaxID=2580413 RepID=A0A5N3PDS1_9HYPH|nr:RES family NAD+ phosphorylase [Microvirga brassicacearum]KAB0267853.1 RES domain-containing protein [Microvirga brassicacearum]
MVESQYVISTIPLVDGLEEQARLEQLIDGTKPPIPEECRHLSPLLYTPFRYVPTQGSRFRRAGQREGAYYTAATVATAVAEMAFYRMLFFAESPETPLPDGFAEYTAFAVDVRTDRLVDIAQSNRHELFHKADYSTTQDFADSARAVGADGIRSKSVRCPSGGATYTWLTCRVFASPAPLHQQSWHMRLLRHGVQAVCENPRSGIEFTAAEFSSDPRLARFQDMAASHHR